MITQHVGKILKTSCVQRTAARNNVIFLGLVIFCGADGAGAVV